MIGGTGFVIRGQAGATVTVDGSRVNASPSLDGNTISLVMPAHAAGKVDVTVTAPLSQAQASVPGGYTYVPLPPPVISELRPNIGSTGGGTPMIIIGAGFRFGLTVTVGGIVTPFEYDDWSVDVLYLSTPAHAAGTVEVIVTNPDGRAGERCVHVRLARHIRFQRGLARVGREPGSLEVCASRVDHSGQHCRQRLVRGRHDGPASSLTLDPPPVVANGEFSFAGSGGVSITGNILSPNSASGSINMASCVSMGQWSVERK